MENKVKLITLLFAALFLVGCPAQEKPYTTAEEQYLVGWFLHNINEETPTELDYSKEDFAEYNYSYNFPASQEPFANLMFWIEPRHVNRPSISAAALIRLGVPLDRVYYVKGQNPNSKYYSTGWSFSNYIKGHSSKNIQEHYRSENLFNAIEPKAGEKRHIYFGKAPYTPASFIVNDNRIRLNGHFLRGYDNNSYLIGFDDPRPPRYEIFIDNVKKAEGGLVKWFPIWRSVIWSYENFDYSINENGNYRVKIFVDTDYAVWDDIIIESSFSVPSDEMQPPEMQHIEASPYFIPGEKYTILADFYDESGIEKVEISVKSSASDDESWTQLPVELEDSEKSIYTSSFTPTGDYKKIYLIVSATDKKGNSIAYSISPVALPAQRISLNLEADSKTGIEKNAIVKGKCKTREGSCNAFLIRHFINNDFLKTDATSKDGSFELIWKVPLEYEADEINFTIKYEGTGIYLPLEEKIAIAVESFDNDIGLFNLKTTEPALGDPIKVSAIVKNLGSKDANEVIVEFKVDSKVLDKKLIPIIDAKKEELVEFKWLPKQEGSYKIELEAQVEGDENNENNKLEKFIEIKFIAPDISAYIFFESVENVIIGTETDVEFQLFNGGEEKAENIKAYLYDFYKPEFAFFNLFPEESKKHAEPEPGQSGGGGGGGGKPEEPTESPSERELIYNGVKYILSAQRHETFVILKVTTEEFKDTLNFTDSDRVEQLQSKVYVYMSFFSDFGVDFILGDASKATKEIGDLEQFESAKDKIKWKPENAGNYKLVLFINATKDSNFDNNYYGENVKVVRTGVNIEAKLDIDYSSKYIMDQESEINATITNHGTADAGNIKVSLFEQEFGKGKEEEELFKTKKKLIGMENIEALKQKEAKSIKFKWKPSKPGENFLLLIAETKGDINPEDNDGFSYIDVLPNSADIFSGIDFIRNDIFVNEEALVTGAVLNRGLVDANDVSASLYEITDNGRRLIDKKEIGTLGTESKSTVEFKWIPSKSGRVTLEIESIASNDDNQENNNDIRVVDVLVKDVDVKVALESYPKFILANENNPVGVSLQNFGSKDATSFDLTLKANDKVVDSIAFKGLGSEESLFAYLNWVPEKDGEFEIKAEIDLIDSDLSNNNDINTVEVFKTRDIKLGFVNSDGKNVDRWLLLGRKERLVKEPTVFRIPDAKLKMWIGDESDNEQIAASIYSKTVIGNTSITSAHLNEPLAQEGLLLYEIFANNDSWDYESFSSFLTRRIETLNIRYTELEGFYCQEYNFSNNKCKEWEDALLETLVSQGSLYATIDTAKAAAIALGDKDYDDDNAPDWEDKDSDNDDIDDEEDTFTCLNGRLKSRKEFNVTVNESVNIGKELKGWNTVKINDKNKKIAEFDANFDRDKLDCREFIVEKQTEVTTRGYTLISGISLINGTKTAYVDKIAGFKRVCIKDEEVDSIDELSQNCDGNNEFLVMCDGIKHGNYTCTDIGSQYRVEGLIHSAVAEPTSCQESWSCTEWSECKDGKHARVCTDSNACGTSFNKPSENRSCGEDEEGEDVEEDDDRSGSSSRTTFDLGEIKGWSDGKSRTLKLGKRDLIIFTFDNKLRNIELEQIKGARISIKLSWSGKSIDLTAGETETFDIDNDKKEDIKFAFETISRDKATVVIERTIEDARVTPPTRVQPQPTGKEDDLRKESEKAEAPREKAKTPSVAAEAKDKGSITTVIVLVSFFAILSALIGLIIYKRDEIMEFISEKTGSKESKPLSEYDKLKSYVLNELSRGFTIDQIREKLEEVGWQKELIELVMRDIRRKK